MSDDGHTSYGKYFFKGRTPGAFRSAENVLGHVYNLFSPKSVIDVGCGQGAWLSAAESRGATILKDLDGDWVVKDDLLSKHIDFTPIDLAVSLPTLKERYDLCISLEVAEHLPEHRADSFVDFLCSTSDTILFSAAIKHQRGTNHINEQWQSFWIQLFRARHYKCLDVIRGAVWNDPAVEWWYKQNTFLFIGPNNVNLNAEDLRALERPVVDVVHPANYEEIIRDYQNLISCPTLRFCAGCIWRWLSIRSRRLIRRAS